MSQRLTPIKRREFIKWMRHLGWEGPYPGGNHQYMKKQSRKIPIPSYQEIDTGLLHDVLTQADVSREEWLAVARR